MNFIIFLLGFVSGIFTVFVWALLAVSSKEDRKEERNAKQDTENR